LESSTTSLNSNSKDPRSDQLTNNVQKLKKDFEFRKKLKFSPLKEKDIFGSKNKLTTVSKSKEKKKTMNIYGIYYP
jgi:hypothetical protein